MWLHMGIHIGDNNKLKNVIIGDNVEKIEVGNKKRTFCEKHPIFVGIFIALFTGIILRLCFWDSIVEYIDNLIGVK